MELLQILYEDIDEVTLEKMPEWFRVLRQAYKKRNYDSDSLPSSE